MVRISIEECFLSEDCTGCIAGSNPLCGWCVVENKCSRVSKCQDTNSTDSNMRWIQSEANSSSDVCISHTLTPSEYNLDDEQVVGLVVVVALVLMSLLLLLLLLVLLHCSIISVIFLFIFVFIFVLLMDFYHYYYYCCFIYFYFIIVIFLLLLILL